MPGIIATRAAEQILCNFNEDKQVQKAPKSSKNTSAASNSAEELAPKSLKKASIAQSGKVSHPKVAAAVQEICCFPVQRMQTDDRKLQTAKKIASMIKNSPAISSKKQLPKSQAKSANPSSVRSIAHENHALKMQKLDGGGKSRQILTVNKPSNLPHNTGIVSTSSNFCRATAKTDKEDRKMYIQEPAKPSVSKAEMEKKFQSGAMQRKITKLTLTRPKAPEFETNQRVRSVKIKSSAEIEEEMMAKIPKFKARPLNEKMFEAPTLPPLPRSAPHLPEFKEFHLETMSRAIHNAEKSTVASVKSSEVKRHQWKPHHLSAPKSPVLQTSLRARPPRIKTSEELEKEELESISQFKARPLNRKIFERKGDMGIFCSMKKPVTIPREFNFATDKRIPPPNAVVDLFNKLSICSESQLENPLPRNTTPNPFHLHTEERGAEKERRVAEELMQKQLEEERARIPRAQPYPYSTDYPVIPPKPEPKPSTKPEPFELESLLRHEQEMQREMEERMRMEMEEAEMRRFKAQPILKADPIPLPKKERKPLTELRDFNLHVEIRAIDRKKFEKKIEEKERAYKKYKEDREAAKMMEEEKAVKQLRRTSVPHARPMPNFDLPFFPQNLRRQSVF